MSSDTPTILKKILARKQEEIIERSRTVSVEQLLEEMDSILVELSGESDQTGS